MDRKQATRVFVAMAVCLSLVLSNGCSSTNGGVNKDRVAGLGEAGIGALLTQAGEGNTTGTLFGVGIGAGFGYLIGNEADRREAQKRQAALEHETMPLANTTWQVVVVTPKPAKPVQSEVGRFNPDGTFTSTTTYWNGIIITDSERYRVVGRTLIISHDDYIINATFFLDGDSLYMDTGEHSIELQRL